jgi:hypothetical protein
LYKKCAKYDKNAKQDAGNAKDITNEYWFGEGETSRYITLEEGELKKQV